MPPQSSGTIQALDPQVIKNARLDKVAAFRSRQINQKDGSEYEVTKLAFYWNTGQTYETNDGEIKPYYVIDGFVTLTGNNRGKIIKILKALGLRNIYDAKGDIAADIDIEFGRIGEVNYEGNDYEDLPLFVHTRTS